MRIECDKRKCYLSVRHQGALTPAVFSDPEQTNPFVFDCDHLAGDTALQILRLNHMAWAEGKLPQPLQAWDFKITYLDENCYVEHEPVDLTESSDLLARLKRGLG